MFLGCVEIWWSTMEATTSLVATWDQCDGGQTRGVYLSGKLCSCVIPLKCTEKPERLTLPYNVCTILKTKTFAVLDFQLGVELA